MKQGRMLSQRCPRIVELLFLCMFLVLSGCAGKRPRDDAPRADLVILHTNDTHAHIAGMDATGSPCFEDAQCTGGLARIAAAIRAAKREGKPVLALDAGDMFQGTLFYAVNSWRMQSDINALMPYDAAVPGNHEWDEGCAELAAYLAKQPYPMLAANLRPGTGCPLQGARYEPYKIFTVGGQKVGVIGLASDEPRESSSACPRTLFADRVRTVQEAVRALEEQGVKRIVLLTHIGVLSDRALARAVDGVDVIVGGHSHTYLGPGSNDGPYPIVEHSPSGKPVLVVTAMRATKYLGELSCSFDADGVLTAWEGQARELVPSAPRDPKVAEKVRSYAETLNPWRKEVVGTHEVDLGPDGMEACRTQQCFSGMLLADAMLDFGRPYGAHIAFCNGGGVRAAIRRGTISLADLMTAFPFRNKVLIREFTGKQIRDVLEHGLSGERGDGRFMQVAGLKYTFDRSRPQGKRILSVERLLANGRTEPLRPRSRYRVVLTSFLARGGDAQATLTKGKVISAPTPIEVDVLRAYVSAHTPVTLKNTPRIVQK